MNCYIRKLYSTRQLQLSPMSTIDEDKRNLLALKNKLVVFSIFDDDLSLPIKEKEIAIDAILDDMIILLKRIRNYEQSDENE